MTKELQHNLKVYEHMGNTVWDCAQPKSNVVIHWWPRMAGALLSLSGLLLTRLRLLQDRSNYIRRLFQCGSHRTTEIKRKTNCISYCTDLLSFLDVWEAKNELGKNILSSDLAQVFEMVFFKTHPAFQIGFVLSSTLQAVYHVRNFGWHDQDGVEHLFFATAAIVCWVIFPSTVILDCYSFRTNKR